jgi:hypothetical protein
MKNYIKVILKVYLGMEKGMKRTRKEEKTKG